MLEIDQWFDSTLGSRVLDTQQAILEQLLPGFFGYHLLQLSIQSRQLYRSSPIHHKFSMGQRQHRQMAFTGDAANLPFEDDSVDVILLHHMLDFSASPQRLLSEVARVSLPMGHIVIVGFNPVSLWGAWQPVGKALGKQPWQGQFIRPGRLMDWLNLLNFKIDRAEYCMSGLPVSSTSDQPAADYSQGLSREANWPFGAVYVIVARKQVGSMIPLRPVWKRNRAFGKLSVVRSSAPVIERNVTD
jgi:SAM-dependent methyltransferase